MFLPVVNKTSTSMKVLGFNPLSMMFFFQKNALNGAGMDNHFCWGLANGYMVEILWHRRETRR